MNTKHLKAKILDLAIRGKLVPQDPSEGNAVDLLKKIREEKNILIEQKKIKADKNSSFIIKAEDRRHYEQFADGGLIDIEDEIPFEIPENWCWCKISEIANKITDGEHNTPKRVPSFQGFYLLSARNIQNGHLALNDVDYVDELEFNRIFARCNPQKNDILISCSGSVGRCTRIEDENKYVMVRSAAMISAPSVNTKYLMYAIQSPELQNQIQYASKQTAQANLFQGAISNLVISLPPLSEQQRIVSAIEKAFEQIDIIEKNKLNLKTYIKQTKSKVLDLAIHGKLVKQNPSEGNATDLLKVQNVIVESEIPFVIPKNWCWCRLGDCSSIISKGTTPKGGKNAYKKDGINFLRIENLNNDGSINHSNIFHISIEDHEGSLKRSKLEAGDLLISIAGTLGKVGFVTEADLPMNTNQAIAFSRLRKNIFDNMYLKYAIESPFVNSELLSKTKVTSIPNLTLEIISNCLIPVPPLDEQQRIVKKIKQIFEQLDILEKSIGD